MLAGMKRNPFFAGLAAAALAAALPGMAAGADPSAGAGQGRPNVVLIFIDDLNDYVEGMGGHPQAKTPQMRKLAESGTLFTNAHSNAPVCAPCRASMFTGVYPHTSRNYHFAKWWENGMLGKRVTLMEMFRANGYVTAGSGKLMHHHKQGTWDEYPHKADYGPFVYDGKERVAHPSVPEPYRSIGAVDGSWAPLSDHPYGPNPPKGKGWIYGKWGKVKPFRYGSADDRDPTPDEICAQWAADRLWKFAKQGGSPFFLGVGFLRPHTPLHVPEKYFDMYPKEQLKLPVIRKGDAEDCHYVRLLGEEKKGPMHFRTLLESYPDMETALRSYIQAYLACVTAVDDCVGQVVKAVDESGLAKNTVIVLVSDHGYHMGEKDYLFKNSLWEESTRIPMIVRAPGVGKAGSKVDHPVSLIDVYPTLVDLCGLKGKFNKVGEGPGLEGFSMKPLMEGRAWDGPEAALSMISSGKSKKPEDQHYSVRTKDWRYALYNDGSEELYDHREDSYEWKNLAGEAGHAATKAKLKALLQGMVGIK
jgi:arylsulfatase A-like enzyme